MKFTFSTPPPNLVQMPSVHSWQWCSAQLDTGVKPKMQRHKLKGGIKWQCCQKGVKQGLPGLAQSAVYWDIFYAVELTLGFWILSSVLALFFKYIKLRDLSCRKKASHMHLWMFSKQETM